MNITDHALMRWAQRQEKEKIINQNTFKIWKSENPEKVSEYTKTLREYFLKSEYLTEGVYDNKGQRAVFHLLKEEMLLFILNKEGENLVTVYDIDFGMNINRNRNILNEFLNYIEEQKKSKEKLEIDLLDDLKNLNRRKKTLEIEKEELREKLNLLESEQSHINKEIEYSRNKGKVLDINIKNTYRKIIKSIEL